MGKGKLGYYFNIVIGLVVKRVLYLIGVNNVIKYIIGIGCNIIIGT